MKKEGVWLARSRGEDERGRGVVGAVARYSVLAQGHRLVYSDPSGMVVCGGACVASAHQALGQGFRQHVACVPCLNRVHVACVPCLIRVTIPSHVRCVWPTSCGPGPLSCHIKAITARVTRWPRPSIHAAQGLGGTAAEHPRAGGLAGAAGSVPRLCERQEQSQKRGRGCHAPRRASSWPGALLVPGSDRLPVKCVVKTTLRFAHGFIPSGRIAVECCCGAVETMVHRSAVLASAVLCAGVVDAFVPVPGRAGVGLRALPAASALRRAEPALRPRAPAPRMSSAYGHDWPRTCNNSVPISLRRQLPSSP
jgi:hypothetical protein